MKVADKFNTQKTKVVSLYEGTPKRFLDHIPSRKKPSGPKSLYSLSWGWHYSAPLFITFYYLLLRGCESNCGMSQDQKRNPLRVRNGMKPLFQDFCNHPMWSNISEMNADIPLRLIVIKLCYNQDLIQGWLFHIMNDEFDPWVCFINVSFCCK